MIIPVNNFVVGSLTMGPEDAPPLIVWSNRYGYLLRKSDTVSNQTNHEWRRWVDESREQCHCSLDGEGVLKQQIVLGSLCYLSNSN